MKSFLSLPTRSGTYFIAIWRGLKFRFHLMAFTGLNRFATNGQSCFMMSFQMIPKMELENFDEYEIKTWKRIKALSKRCYLLSFESAMLPNSFSEDCSSRRNKYFLIFHNPMLLYRPAAPIEAIQWVIVAPKKRRWIKRLNWNFVSRRWL